MNNYAIVPYLATTNIFKYHVFVLYKAIFLPTKPKYPNQIYISNYKNNKLK